MITIIDYGMGNLRSVQKSFEKIGVAAKISQDLTEIKEASALVLPGVGSFGAAITNLTKLKLIQLIIEKVRAGTPLLGICLGYQVLFEKSEEAPGLKGLALLKGEVKLFSFTKEQSQTRKPIPHMGWNQVKYNNDSLLFKDLPQNNHFYFVHSYYVAPADQSIIAGLCSYGFDFAAAIEHKNIYATQFHPEKSSPYGLKILENFARICSK
jgi:imidazole glycerol-phosphate synthase subunit HisH